MTDLGVVEGVCGDHSLLPARLQQILLDGTSVTSRSDTIQILIYHAVSGDINGI